LVALHISITEPNKIQMDNLTREDATEHEKEMVDALEEYLVTVFTAGSNAEILYRLRRSMGKG